jgi:hypothetical protein
VEVAVAVMRVTPPSRLLTVHNSNFYSVRLLSLVFLILILFLRTSTSYCMLFHDVLCIVTCDKINNRFVKIK